MAWKTSLENGPAVALQQLKSVALQWLISGDIRQASRPLQLISQASLPGAGYGQFEHKADSLIAKFEAKRNGQKIGMSRVTAIISLWLSASSSVSSLGC